MDPVAVRLEMRLRQAFHVPIFPEPVATADANVYKILLPDPPGQINARFEDIVRGMIQSLRYTMDKAGKNRIQTLTVSSASGNPRTVGLTVTAHI